MNAGTVSILRALASAAVDIMDVQCGRVGCALLRT